MMSTNPSSPGARSPRRAVGLVALAALILAACNSAPPPRDGRITDRDRAYVKHYGWRYYLQTQATDGSIDRGRVSGQVYEHCFRGSAYPACANR